MDDIRSRARGHMLKAAAVISLPDTIAKEKDWDTAARELLDASVLCLQKGRECSIAKESVWSGLGPETTTGTPVSKGE